MGQPVFLHYSCIFLLVTLILATSSVHAQGTNQPIQIYFTDFGICNWVKDAKPYQNFQHNVKGHVRDDVNTEVGQILLPMPDDNELPQTVEQHLQYINKMSNELYTRIDNNSGKTKGKFEIQMVEHIEKAGYVDPIRQEKCATYAQDVYMALQIAKQRLQQSHEVNIDAIVGSNGGHVFTEIVPTLRYNPFDRVVLISPRAYADDTIETYDAMKGKLAIINESGDAPSGPFMVSLLSTAKYVQTKCPNMSIFYVDTFFHLPIEGHLQTMGADAFVDKVWKIDGENKTDITTHHGKAVIEDALDSVSTTKKVWNAGDLGGIDLTNIRLSYISAIPDKHHQAPTHLFTAPMLRGAVKPKLLNNAVNLSMNAFLIGLAASSDKFWVNLNPTEPNRLVDATLANTDIARILLEADLQMKKDVAVLTDPRSCATGKEYWERLTAIASRHGPLTHITQRTRYWIVPGTIEIGANRDGIYLQRADLQVKLQSISSSLNQDANMNTDGQTEESIEQELILPPLVDIINHASQYAALRQIYSSLVLATWYRSNYRNTLAPYADRIDSNNLEGLASTRAWTHVRYMIVIYNRITRVNMTLHSILRQLPVVCAK